MDIADISVIKTVSPQLVIVGDVLTYSIVVYNAGPNDAQNVSVADAVPTSIINVQFSIDNGSTWNNWATPYLIGTLPMGKKVTILIRGKVTKGSTSSITNTVTVTSSTVDPNLSNNTSSVTTNIYNVGLTLTKNVDANYAIVGETLTYTLVARNTGEFIVGDVKNSPITVYDILSPSLSFVSGSVAVDGILNPEASIVSGVEIGQLQPGQSRVVTFKAKILSNNINPIMNTSSAKFGYNISGYASQTGNVSSNTVSVIPELANIDIAKNGDKDFAVVNDIITYTLILKNTGTVDAINVIFRDDVPSNVELIEGTFKINNVVVNGVNLNRRVNIGTIKVGQQCIIQYSVKVIDSNCKLKIVNSASVKFNYTLPDGTEGTTETETSLQASDVINLGISEFKQFSVDEELIIPCEKPDIEEVNDVYGEIEIVKSHVIRTPSLISNEGQILTGFKLIVHGFVKEVVEYTALDTEQSVHSAHYVVPFTTFIVLPKNYCTGNLEINPEIENISYRQINKRVVFTNATILIKASVCRCDNK